jgi:hypothetical protein
MKVKFTMSMSLVGCEREEIIEFDDDTTNDDIDFHYEHWVNEQLDGGWEEVE